MLRDTEGSDVRDTALISAAQRIEHYEMAAYGAVRSYVEKIGNAQVVEILQKTLDEEKAADKKLTEIAHSIRRPIRHAA